MSEVYLWLAVVVMVLLATRMRALRQRCNGLQNKVTVLTAACHEAEAALAKLAGEGEDQVWNYEDIATRLGVLGVDNESRPI